MKYIFLTFSMVGVTGGPSYVNNKVKWLLSNGWNVTVIDHYRGLNMKGEIVLENLIPFRNNRLLELFFPPAYFSQKQKRNIIEKLCSIIGNDEDYVIETNSTRLALWGELLAKHLYAKHLILLVGEHPIIRNEKQFDYLNFKFIRNELFTISPRVLKLLFSGYREINDLDANNHTFSASMGVVPEEVPLPEIENIPLADYKVLSFGRLKPYFKNMIESIVEFSNHYPEKKINFIIMGDVLLPENLIRIMDSCSNLFYKFIPAKRPVPKSIFRYSDLVIATAGCANIAFNQGVKTISMNVENNQPLGVMGYTTINSAFSNDNRQITKKLSELIEEVLVKKLYDGAPLLKKEASKKGYPYQISLINNDREYWKNADMIYLDGGMKRIVQIIILKLHCLQFYLKIISGQNKSDANGEKKM